jgi:predicted amidohydrolase
MRVTLLQLDVDLTEERESRISRACEMISAQFGADLVVLPEIWSTGYFAFDRYASTAEPVDGPTSRALADAARSASVHLHAGSIVERGPDGSLYNTSLLFSPTGDLVHTQRKFHVFGYRSREAELLRGGDEIEAHRSALGVIGMTTCYDLRFPELYRVLADQDAELLIVPAAWPQARLAHWRLLTRARAVENQCFLLACNTAGTQNGVALAGHSAIVDPWGETVAEAGLGAETLTAEFDLDVARRLRADFPVLHDRRLRVTHPSATQPQASEREPAR